MSKKGDRLRDKAELAEMVEELADQWDAFALTMASYLGDRAAANDFFRAPLAVDRQSA
jgi:hypothetical protein